MARVLVVLALAACAERAAPPTDAWRGRWNGPEGTFLRIDGDGGRYAIVIQDLDGPKAYTGLASADTIVFERAGVPQAIRATDGAGTGMKWLAGKKDCLVIRSGEGFCRD